LPARRRLGFDRSGSVATVSWDGAGFTLQQATNNLGASNSWRDVIGPIKTSPYSVTSPAVTTLYRLRN